MMGPVILEYLVDYYTRFNSSIDAMLTVAIPQVSAVLVPIQFLTNLHVTFFL